MRELALFSGAGGGILGGHLLGWRTVCAVECESYASDVLIARQDDGLLPPFPVWDDVRTFDGRPWRGAVDVVSGGFPCQDISAAGNGAGLGGERSGLWSEMARIVCDVRPRFVFVENSPMLTSRGLGRVLGDLAALGFDAEWTVLGADDCGAPHRRKRIWIVAHAVRHRRLEGRLPERARAPQPRHRSDVPDPDSPALRHESGRVCGQDREGPRELADDGDARDLPHADSGRCEVERGRGVLDGERAPHGDDPNGRDCPVPDASGQRVDGRELCPPGDGRSGCAPRPWPVEPDVGRVAHGVAARVDRLRATGNGQVPRVAARAFELLRARGGW